MKRWLTLLALTLAALLGSASVINGPIVPATGAPTPDILWWKMNENTGTTVGDSSSLGTNTGTCGANWTTGKAGSGLIAFSGNYITTTSALSYGTNKITVAFWINQPTSWTGTGEVLVESSAAAFSNANSFAIETTDGTALFFTVAGTSGQFYMSGPVPGVGGWHHVMAVFDNSSGTGALAYYLDGVSQTLTPGGSSKSGTSNFASYTLNVMSRNGSGTNVSTATIDDLRIWSGDRTASVAAVMAAPQ